MERRGGGRGKPQREDRQPGPIEQAAHALGIERKLGNPAIREALAFLITQKRLQEQMGRASIRNPRPSYFSKEEGERAKLAQMNAGIAPDMVVAPETDLQLDKAYVAGEHLLRVNLYLLTQVLSDSAPDPERLIRMGNVAFRLFGLEVVSKRLPTPPDPSSHEVNLPQKLRRWAEQWENEKEEQ